MLILEKKNVETVIAEHEKRTGERLGDGDYIVFVGSGDGGDGEEDYCVRVVSGAVSMYPAGFDPRARVIRLERKVGLNDG